METLRFLMTSTYYPPFALGGDAYFVKYLSEELVKRGHEVHVFYSSSAFDLMRPGRATLQEFEENAVIRHGYSYKRPRIGIMSSLAFGRDGNAVRELEALRKEVRPDIVHWHNTRGFICNPVPDDRALNLHTAHDYYTICPRANLLRPRMIRCNRARLCSFCSIGWKKPPQIWRLGNRRVLNPDKRVSVISPSKFLATRLQDEGVEVRWILPNFAPDAGVRETRLPDEATDAIIYLGMLEPHKGVLTLMRSFINTIDQQGFILELVGDGSMKSRLERIVRNRDLRSRIHVRGFISREDLDGLLSSATMQIVPSEWYENAPLVAMEALSRGIPVLSSDMGGLPEIMTPESGATLFTGGDSKDLERKLVLAWNQRNDMHKNGLKARRMYEQRYSPSVHVRKYESILSQAGND